MANKKSELEKGEPKNVRIVVEASPDAPAFYVNYAEIATGPHEFSIMFAMLPAKPTAADIAVIKEQGALFLDAELKVLIAPTLLPGLILGIKYCS